MKSFDSRAYSINDFLEWKKNNQLELNPRFQRRSVWSENAKSYLMDTIIRGKPIPKIFIRQKLNATTKSSIREVVDGQQRLRTILAYMDDGFQINKKHNSQYGGLFFSQLGTVDGDIQANILNYEISVDLLVNLPDSEILDVFGRLNSYAVVLNEQERINADHFGPFKRLADDLGHTCYDFWLINKILSSAQILRMGDAALAADLLLAMIEGIKAKNQVKLYYDQYEKSFDHDPDVLRDKFLSILEIISKIFDNSSLSTSEFHRVSLFYSLFAAIYHMEYGLKDFPLDRQKIKEKDYSKMRVVLERIESIYIIDDKHLLDAEEIQFLEDSRRATTDTNVRGRRTNFIVKRILSQ